MNRTDPDLLAVRDLPPGSADPSDESVSRTWYLLNARQTAARGRAPRRWARLLVPAAAGLVVVAAVAVGAVTLGGFGSGQFAAPNIDLIKASYQPLPTARGVDPRLSRTTPEAVAALEELARTAEGGATEGGAAVTLEPGRLIHVRTDGWAASVRGEPPVGDVKFQPREEWLDPAGMLALKLLDGERDMFAGPRSDHGAELERLRGLLAEQGPSVEFPTPQWLAQLPTDPAQLLARLRADIGDNDSWSRDHLLWDAVGNFYQSCDILLNPRLRAALLRSFQGMDGLTAGEVMVDDLRLIAIRHSDGDSATEILFDPVTAWAVGRRSLSLRGELPLRPPPSGPRFDPLPQYHATWTQNIVGSVDER